MQLIPLQPVPSQSLTVVLDGQNCQLAIYQKPQCIFVDLNADGVDIATGVQARNAVALNPFPYSSFSGNLFFIDTQGSDDPIYTGLGSRFVLVYVTAAELA